MVERAQQKLKLDAMIVQQGRLTDNAKKVCTRMCCVVLQRMVFGDTGIRGTREKNGSACMEDHSTAESRGEEWVDLGVVCGFTTMRALPRDLAMALRGRDRERRREKKGTALPRDFLWLLLLWTAC